MKQIRNFLSLTIDKHQCRRQSSVYWAPSPHSNDPPCLGIFLFSFKNTHMVIHISYYLSSHLFVRKAFSSFFRWRNKGTMQFKNLPQIARQVFVEAKILQHDRDDNKHYPEDLNGLIHISLCQRKRGKKTQKTKNKRTPKINPVLGDRKPGSLGVLCYCTLANTW